jgi:hypothetical protein
MPLLQYFGAMNTAKVRPNNEDGLIVGVCRDGIEVKEGDPCHPLNASTATTVGFTFTDGRKGSWRLRRLRRTSRTLRRRISPARHIRPSALRAGTF